MHKDGKGKRESNEKEQMRRECKLGMNGKKEKGSEESEALGMDQRSEDKGEW